MKSLNAALWGDIRDLSIDYEDENATTNQLKTVKMFFTFWTVVDKSSADVVAYCKERYADDVAGLSDAEILKLVEPRYILVPRTMGWRDFAIMCDFAPDPENGLAVKFRNEELAGVMPRGEVKNQD